MSDPLVWLLTASAFVVVFAILRLRAESETRAGARAERPAGEVAEPTGAAPAVETVPAERSSALDDRRKS